MSLSLHLHITSGYDSLTDGVGGEGGSKGGRQREAYMHVNMHIHVCMYVYVNIIVHTHNNEVPHHTRCTRPPSPEVGNLPTYVCPPDITKIKSRFD